MQRVPPPVEAWAPWRPDEIVRRLEGVGVDWCVVGGWAVDLWRGEEPSRETHQYWVLDESLGKWRVDVMVEPAGLFLFKSRNFRPKDIEDFEGALPLMDREAKNWLRAALEKTQPGHPWIDRLTA